MSQRYADVMVHIDESLDEATLNDLEDEIQDTRGVVRVAHCPERPHLMMVDYDAHLVRSAHFIQQIRAHGMHAQLVGL